MSSPFGPDGWMSRDDQAGDPPRNDAPPSGSTSSPWQSSTGPVSWPPPTASGNPPTAELPFVPPSPPPASPAYGSPSFGTPGQGAPGYGAPGYGGQITGAPQYGAPAYGAPGAPSYGGPDYGGPDYGAAGHGTPNAANHRAASSRRGPGWGGVIGVSLVLAVVAAGAASGITYAATDHRSSSTSADGNAPANLAAPNPKADGSVATAASLISPSVVTVNVSAGQDGGTGSGIVIKDGGYILTNNHVVTLDSQTDAKDNTITVTSGSGDTQKATVVGTDEPDDLAVIRVSGGSFKTAGFASSSALKVGQTVVAMGAPLGLSNTVTSGIVSALDRPISTGDEDHASIFDAIQTDAAINPGNSGGPLIDLSGRVVGVDAAIAGTGSSENGAQSGNIGIGFAIPSDEASRIANELIDTGKATHAVLGVTVSGPESNTGPTSSLGATVTAVTQGGPADRAGIKAGDVITKIGDQRIDDSVGAIAATRSHAPKSTVSVTVDSHGSSHTYSVVLGSTTG